MNMQRLTTTEKLIDLQVIRTNLGSIINIEELFKIVINVLNTETTLMAKAIEEQNWNLVKNISHRLNGLSSYTGAYVLRGAARALENSLVEAQFPLIENLSNNLSQK